VLDNAFGSFHGFSQGQPFPIAYQQCYPRSVVERYWDFGQENKAISINLTIDISCEICFPEYEAIYWCQVGEQEDAKE
jgi:hypothetical protein